MKSDAAVRLEEAASIVTRLARQWRETIELDDSGLIDRRGVDEIVGITESTARNLRMLAAAWLPDSSFLEMQTGGNDTDIRVIRMRLEEGVTNVL